MRNKNIIFIIIIALACLFMYSYFHVNGSDIKEISKISDTTNVTIRKSGFNVSEEKEVVLDLKQKEMLKSLFKDSDFINVLSSVLYFKDKDYYDIIINDIEKDIHLSICSMGGEYIHISHNRNYLKVLDPEWKKKLEEIICLYD